MEEYTSAYVVSSKTGEIIHEFSKMDMFLGKQYMTAKIVGRFYTIDKVEVAYGALTFYVH